MTTSCWWQEKKSGGESKITHCTSETKRTDNQRRQNKVYEKQQKKRQQKTFLQIDAYKFQEVEEFKYLGVTITGGNDRNKEIKERIRQGIKPAGVPTYTERQI
ncbi:hypothetical protein Zmor_020735 [Zophobas morio]|uniref:Uncharacterized protein n=1 Tax=Zophobas morio TaxID=2755281 RepID=A0AA38I443_9CUCU|nr:hypothetical protein Zmor_020735 [Zophobas morio]